MKPSLFLMSITAAAMIALPISAQAEELKWSVSNSVDEYVLAKFVYENGYKIPEHRDGIRIRPDGSITIDLQCEAGQRDRADGTGKCRRRPRRRCISDP